MKTKTLIAIVTLILIAGCQKAKLLKQIDGNWKINRIVYSGGTLIDDSVITNPSMALFFERCGLKESRSLGNCIGKYGETANQARFNYSFQEDDYAGLNLSIYAAPPLSEIEKYNNVIRDIAGQYDIIELNASTLKIKSTCCVNWPLGSTTYRTRYIEASK